VFTLSLVQKKRKKKQTNSKTNNNKQAANSIERERAGFCNLHSEEKETS